MSASPWIVHKFGGSSLANAKCFHQVSEILKPGLPTRQAVVVSAVGGVTDALLGLVDSAEANDGTTASGLAEVRKLHDTLAAKLLPDAALADFRARLRSDCQDIADVLHATTLLRSASESARTLVAGFGELWAARLLAAFLQILAGETGAKVRWLDARKVLVVDRGEMGPVVDWSRSRASLLRELEPGFVGTVIVTGYIASDSSGRQTTLGRNGSDFSASIVSTLLEAGELHIWTDVDGIMSGDPARVLEAAVIPSMSYNEAMELAYFGARVIHPQTMGPAVERGIPIYIRNTFAPKGPGTRVGGAPLPEIDEGHQIKGITSIDDIALVNLEGAGMIGVPGTADRLFSALRQAGISVVLISQASSEHSICFAVPEPFAERVREIVERAFATELQQGQIQRVGVTRGCSILAVVGDGMAGTPGVAGRVFGTLGAAGVNVRAIAQGSSERNISAVIDQADTTRALQAVHSGFYLSPETLSIGLIGPGTIGATLLDQLAGQLERLAQEANLDLRVRGVATTGKMLLADTRLELADWRSALAEQGRACDLDAFVRHIHAEHLPHAVIIDCTASAQVAGRYADWLGAGIHVITPNKIANAGPYAYYDELRRCRRAGPARYLYETTVGAGLPIIQTLRDLRETGDEIIRIEGVLSGTLAYLFNCFDGRRPFSELLAEAKLNGYTEPDPREDLSGMDVARKLIILGREMGLELELADVAVEGLVPEALAGGSVEEFMNGLRPYDQNMARLVRNADSASMVLRYVGRIDADGKASVGLGRFLAGHAFANITHTDNIVQFVTERYRDNPLIVQGPGAGPDVTAAGVFADLLRLASYLGATL